MNILSVDGIVIWPNSNINPTNGSDIKCAFINSVPPLAFHNCGAGRPVICKRSESLILVIAFWCTDYFFFDCMELPLLLSSNTHIVPPAVETVSHILPYICVHNIQLLTHMTKFSVSKEL